MNQRQQNSLNMYQAVIDLFNVSPAVWNTIIPVLNAFGLFHGLYDQLTGKGLNQQQGNTKGYTAQKNKQKAALIKLAKGLALKLTGYAKVNNNAILLQAVDYSISQLDRSREFDLVNICQTIHNKGVEFKTAAADYDITDGELADMQTALDLFKPMSTKRDNVGDTRTLATGSIEKMLKEGVRLLDLLDPLVEGLIKNKEFVDAYFQARKITDRTGRGKGKDENNDVPPTDPEV